LCARAEKRIDGRMQRHLERQSPGIDPRALREQLMLDDGADMRSPAFQRFVIRLSEAIDFDIPAEDAGRLTTLSGCVDYLRDRVRT
jgi:hypothetical protein